MLTTFSDVFGGCDSFSQSVAVANERRAEIEKKANEFVHSKGYSYNVKCEVAKTYFTTRKYENVTLPAGEYTAVRLLIGNAEGRNWWCVMFPPLCLPAASGEFFTEEQSKRVEESRDYEIKFAIFEALQGLFADFQVSAYIVAIHPHIFFIGLFRFQMVEDVIGNGGNLVVKLLIGF